MQVPKIREFTGTGLRYYTEPNSAAFLMFLTKKHISRRALLKGAGVSVALPLLDAMIPAGTALAQTAAARKVRVGFFYLPHGAIMNNTRLGPQMDRWMPTGSGADYKLNVITRSLEPHKKYVTSFGNLKNDVTIGAAQHTINPATWLSGVRPDTNSATPRMSVTLDQVIADSVGSETFLPSLQLSSERSILSQDRPNYLTLSFRNATTPMAMEYNPRTLFLQLFGRPDAATVTKETASLLDNIKEQTAAMQRELQPGDRAVLDSYLTEVRETERKLQEAQRRIKDIPQPPMPRGVSDRFEDQVNIMFDLIALAYRADMTRVVTFMMAMERTNMTYDHIGVRESFHPLSHHANQLDRIEPLVKIQTWHTERFAAFLDKLAAEPDGEGTLLDNAMLLYGSNMSSSDKHDAQPLPTLLVGGGAGKLAGGRHIELPVPTPITNLYLALLGKVGLEHQSFGDSTGSIPL